MATKKVVVSGGGQNLYRVTESGSRFIISHANVGVFTDSFNRIGEARNFDDALSVVKTHSGKRIEKISNW